MPLIGISIKLERIDEKLLYQDKGGGWWLSCVCSLDADDKGRKERYAAGEKGPALGTWREIGGNHGWGGKPAFDLSKYRKPTAPEQPSASAPLFPDEEGAS